MTSYPAEKVGEQEKELARSDSIVDEKHSFKGEGDGSSIIEGSEGVTEYELATLRHLPDRLPYTSWLVVLVEFAERYVVCFFILLGH
jgi:POT family proton-dependent oligopeptide transporter